MCREGRLYDIEDWVNEESPLQLAPAVAFKGPRPKTALQIALQSGQHSLTLLLLKSGYRMELECYSVLDIALETRRWDLFELLLDWGADLHGVDIYTVLETYNADLYKQFYSAGYDLTAGHELGMYLGSSTSNRPLLGFAKRHRLEDPKLQLELNIALCCHVRTENEKGVKLCLWAGADPHAPAPDPEFSLDEDDITEGWSAIEEAASTGGLNILKLLKPNPRRDNFDNLYRYTRDASIITYLLPLKIPQNLTLILSSHINDLDRRFGRSPCGTGAIEALLNCGVRWEVSNTEALRGIRRILLKADDYDLRRVLTCLKKPELCHTETYQELTRPPRMQERMIAIGLARKRINERERRRSEIARLTERYDRELLFKQVWSQPVQHVAKEYGISGVALGKTCRKLRIPVPPRGFWTRIRAGHAFKKPPLGKL